MTNLLLCADCDRFLNLCFFLLVHFRCGIDVVADLAVSAMLSDVQCVIRRLEEKRVLLRHEQTGPPDDPRFAVKKGIICAHKQFEDETGENFALLQKTFSGFTILTTSILDDESLATLRRGLFQALSIIRVYTKQVGKEVELVNPVVLPIGGTVDEAATSIHKDFEAKLKYARIWGEGKYDGQRVTRDYVLRDGDIIEFHI